MFGGSVLKNYSSRMTYDKPLLKKWGRCEARFTKVGALDLGAWG